MTSLNHATPAHASARDHLIARLYDCKTQSDRIYAQTRLLARFASPFRFDLADRAMQIFGHEQRRVTLVRTDNGLGVAFTFHDDGTLEITHRNCEALRNQTRQPLDLSRALAALDAYLDRALATPENSARLRRPVDLKESTLARSQ